MKHVYEWMNIHCHAFTSIRPTEWENRKEVKEFVRNNKFIFGCSVVSSSTIVNNDSCEYTSRYSVIFKNLQIWMSILSMVYLESHDFYAQEGCDDFT